MDKIIERGLLFDFYGDLLTDHQKNIYSEAVFNDMSLSELSQEEGISRQGIHDLIKRCDKLLESYDEKLKLIERFKRIKSEVSRLDADIDKACIDADVKERLKDGLKNIIGEL